MKRRSKARCPRHAASSAYTFHCMEHAHAHTLQPCARSSCLCRCRSLNILTPEQTSQLPDKPADTVLHNLAHMFKDDPYFRALDAFPAPLASGNPKEEVVKYLQDCARSAADGEVVPHEREALLQLLQVSTPHPLPVVARLPGVGIVAHPSCFVVQHRRRSHHRSHNCR